MSQNLITAIAFMGGICLAVQSAFASQLSTILKNPIMASISTYSSGSLFAIIFILTLREKSIHWQAVTQVPWYLWFIGGLFSVTGITLYYFAIPKTGVGTVIALGLSGQLFFAVVAGHFGWLGLPVEPISVKRLFGIIAILAGIFFIVYDRES